MNDILLYEEILNCSLCGLQKNQIHILETVNSTNLYCRELIKAEARHETLVVADFQTDGRGRTGRRFYSPDGTGIYMSLIVSPSRINLDPNLLTVAAGVAVCRVLKEHCRVDAQIKWVNDIFVNGKKVCGILAESILNPISRLPEFIIVGIGINISTETENFPEDIKDIAGSVFPQGISRNEIISQIVNNLHHIYMKEATEALIEEYKSLSLVLGRKISFTQNGKAFFAAATDINMEGNLVVRTEQDDIITLKSGEISLGSANFTQNA